MTTKKELESMPPTELAVSSRRNYNKKYQNSRYASYPK
jgi:hypothetical protein